MISSKNDFEHVSSNPVDKANALHVEISSVCLQRRPAVAYLFLVRSMSRENQLALVAFSTLSMLLGLLFFVRAGVATAQHKPIFFRYLWRAAAHRWIPGRLSSRAFFASHSAWWRCNGLSKNPKDECSVVSDFAGAFQVTLDLSGTNLTLTLTLPMEPGSENNSS
jgi:hypothetical protein